MTYEAYRAAGGKFGRKHWEAAVAAEEEEKARIKNQLTAILHGAHHQTPDRATRQPHHPAVGTMRGSSPGNPDLTETVAQVWGMDATEGAIRPEGQRGEE